MNWITIGLYASIAVTGVLVIGFVAETTGLINSDTSGGGDPNAKIIMLCANPDCKAVAELSRDEYRDIMQEEMENSEGGPMGMMMPGMGPMVITCTECSEKSLYMARKCEECEEIFIEDYTVTDDYPDRCPECGYSRMEDMRNKR
jgi:DNA-directed RNA polymerase subunit RPC12/RpoP